MKKLLNMVAVTAMLLAGSCQKYNDTPLKNRVDDLENRVVRLEELCKQMNTNIASLQTLVTALQNNDYATGITPIVRDGETIGYTVSFTQSAPITIYCNENGASVGAGGHTPVIGVRQDTDGLYYWTLDGEWLLDDAGNKIKAEGRDGKDGQDGASGASGKDGVTPQLKIEEGYWYVSTDNGTTWTNLGKATGENGKDSADSSDSIFKAITQDDDYIYFALKNGETIVLPKKQQLTITFAEGPNLTFYTTESKIIHYTITGGNTNNVVKAEMQNNDAIYTLHTTFDSATQGTIRITSTNVPKSNRIIVSVSDGNHTIMSALSVGIQPSSIDGPAIIVDTPGTLSQLLEKYDISTITKLVVIGSLNSTDIAALNKLPNLETLDIENTSITELPKNAFYNNQSLTSIVLPRLLKTIGESSFEKCSNLVRVDILSNITTFKSRAFSYCENLKSTIIIPANVVDFGGTYVFEKCSGELLVNSNTPNVDTTQASWFYNTNFTKITVGDNVTALGNYAFSGTFYLENLIIGSNVKSIGNYALNYYNKPLNIYCKAQTPPTISSSTFSGWSNCPLYVPTGCKEAYAAAAYWKNAKEIIEMEF